MSSQNALLVVSFGTSVAETRRRTLGAIEEELRSAYPDRLFFRAWTSGFLRQKVARTEGIEIDSLSRALERLREAGAEEVLVQPTHMLPGQEYSRLRADLERARGDFSRVLLGAPLLAEREDVIRLAGVVEEIFAPVVKEGDMLALMGHGSEGLAEAENPYLLLDSLLGEAGFHTVPLLRGLGEYPQVRQLYLRHAAGAGAL